MCLWMYNISSHLAYCMPAFVLGFKSLNSAVLKLFSLRTPFYS